MSINRLTPYMAIHPGSILKEELKARSIKQVEFAKMIGFQQSNLSRLLKGQNPITTTIANKLETALGIPASNWLGLQARYEKDLEEISERDAQENIYNSRLTLLAKIINIPTLISKGIGINIPASLKEQYEVIRNFLNIKSPYDVQHIVDKSANYRRTASKNPDQLNLATWICIVHGKTKDIKVKTKPDIEKAKSELSKLFNKGYNSYEEISDIFLKNGIIYIEIPHLKSTYVDGYSFLREDETPVIATSRRFSKQHDRIAFYVMHELGHVALHLTTNNSQDSYISIDGYSTNNKEEIEANNFASNALISKEIWDKIISEQFTLVPATIKRVIAQQCKKYGINYDIAIGRYKHEMNNYKF